LPIRMANVVRNFFSNLYDSRTNRLATAPTATTAKRNVQRTISPGVILVSALSFEVAVAYAAVVKPSEMLLSAALIIALVFFPSIVTNAPGVH